MKPTHVRRGQPALAALLRREAEPSRIAVALAAAVHGFAVIEPDFAEALRLSLPDRAPSRSAGTGRVALVEPLVEPLTPRELEVLRLMAEGLPNKTIAARLDISEHTVKFHVNTILGKLGVAVPHRGGGARHSAGADLVVIVDCGFYSSSRTTPSHSSRYFPAPMGDARHRDLRYTVRR